MSYYRMDHAAWVERSTGQTLSPLGRKVADILGVVGGGIYNAPIKHDNVDWSDDYVIVVNWRGYLATVDFDRLTRLVFLCHRARIRCEISPKTFKHIELMFHQRKPDGSTAINHPTLAEAVATFERDCPADHPITYDGDRLAPVKEAS